MTATPAAPARKTTSSKKTSGKRKQTTTEKLLGIPSQPTRQQAIDSYAEKGAESYADRRLLDLTTAVERIAFWVTLWSVLSLVGFGITLLVMVANS